MRRNKELSVLLCAAQQINQAEQIDIVKALQWIIEYCRFERELRDAEIQRKEK
jgi:hypothetical protein